MFQWKVIKKMILQQLSVVVELFVKEIVQGITTVPMSAAKQ